MPTAEQHTFAPIREQISVARRFVSHAVDRLGGSIDLRMKEDIALLTSEAVANAVEHAGTDIDVTVTRVGPAYLICVHDDSPAAIPESKPITTEFAANGRGLAVIDSVAAAWGVDDVENDGKTIWFVPMPPELRARSA